jgi:ribose transport system substrate-binding protein
MKKWLATVLALCMMVTLTAGLSTTKVEAARQKLHFVYVSPLLAHPVWLIAKQGFDQACKELNIYGDWVGPQGIAPEEMAKLIEIAVAQKADAIITQGLVPAAPLRMAENAKIPVLVVDSDIPDAKKIAYLGKDFTIQAKLLLEAAEKRFGKDKPLVVSIQVASLSYKTATDAMAAIKTVFAQHKAGVKIVNETESKSDKMKSTTEWENTFKAYPDINVAISLGAEGGPACAKVAQELKLGGKVAVYAVDDIQETLDCIKAGTIDGSVVTSFYNYGYQATYWLYQNITKGKKPAKINNDAGTMMVNKENINSYANILKKKVDLK